MWVYVFKELFVTSNKYIYDIIFAVNAYEIEKRALIMLEVGCKTNSEGFNN